MVLYYIIYLSRYIYKFCISTLFFLNIQAYNLRNMELFKTLIYLFTTPYNQVINDPIFKVATRLVVGGDRGSRPVIKFKYPPIYTFFFSFYLLFSISYVCYPHGKVLFSLSCQRKIAWSP